VLLRWQKNYEHGKDQSHNQGPSPARLMVPEKPNIGIVDKQTEDHADYEQKDKAQHLVRQKPGHNLADGEHHS
jgi:hypothetical protein